MISDGLWQRLYGADPAILGKQIRLDTDPHTIVGVMPLGFRHPGRTIENAVEVWITPGLASQHPEEYPAKARWSARLTALQDDLTGNVRTTLLVVFGAVVCVLLICSVSIANLVVAKAA